MHKSVAIAAAFGAALTMSLSNPLHSQQTQSPSARGSDAGTSPSAKKGQGDVSRGDRRLMTRAAQMGLAEVAASKVAMEKASTPQVKKFAEQMVQEHEKANAELKEIASSKGVNLPTSPTAKHQEAVKELRGLSGAKFDQKYMAQAGVKDHKAALELFQDGAKKADDPQLKSFFEKNLAHIKQHLAMAQEVEQRGDGSSSGTSKKQEGSTKK